MPSTTTRPIEASLHNVGVTRGAHAILTYAFPSPRGAVAFGWAARQALRKEAEEMVPSGSK